MRKLIAAGIVMLTLLLCLPVRASAATPVASGTAGDSITWELTSDGVLTFSGVGEMPNYESGEPPFSSNLRPAPWWDYKDQITSVVISRGITTIGNSAFYRHYYLRSVTLPDTLTSIGFFAFFRDAYLSGIDIPSSVTSVGNYSFFFCTSMRSLSLPDTVTYIGEAAFSNCQSLPSVHIPSSLKTLYEGVFCNCYGLTSVTIPAGITTIYDQAFEGCDSLTEIVFEHGADDPLSFRLSDYRYPPFGLSSELATRVGVPDRKNINPAIAEYDWAGGNRTVTWFSTVAPTITSHPKDVTVGEDSTASFKVRATGKDLNYQWYYQKPGEDTWNKVSSNGTSAAYSLKAQTRHDGYQYRCKVFNSLNVAWSKAVTLSVVTKPVIKTQPSAVTVTEGDSAGFSVKAEGEKLSYQWYYQKSGSSAWTAVTKNGASASYSLTTAARHDGYQYRCEVSNPAGTVTSKAAALTVLPPPAPVVKTQPSNVTVDENGTARFSVKAEGVGLSYQWYYQKPGSSTWTAVSANGTSAAYSLTAQERHNGYRYYCEVSNRGGSVKSKTVTLTVVVPPRPTITTQPKNVAVDEGSTASFKVAATPAGTNLSYQWYYLKPGSSTWTAVSTNGSSATYKLTAQTRHNGYQYRCLVKDSLGEVYSKTVTLTVYAVSPPHIYSQTVSKTVFEGNSATFQVTAEGKSLSYQWYYRKPGSSTWTAVSKNGTSSSYTLTAEARHNGYSYKCRVSNPGGSVDSETMSLTVYLKADFPSITSGPSSVSVSAGQKATFKVTATGKDISYQWYYQKPGSSDLVAVSSNGTSATYTLTAQARHNGYIYYCKVSNSMGSTISCGALLTVN